MHKKETASILNIFALIYLENLNIMAPSQKQIEITEQFIKHVWINGHITY